MKISIIANYTFNKVSKTVTFLDFATIDLNRILSVTDVTNGIQIYSYRINQYGGSVSTNVLTLNYDTNNARFENTDKLYIEIVGDNFAEQIVASGVRGDAPYNSSEITNYDHKGAIFFINTTIVEGTATPTMTIKIQMKDIVSSIWVDVPGAVTAGITAPGQTLLAIYPGLTVSANAKVDYLLPRTYRVSAAFTGTTPAFTFSVSANYIN